MSVQSKFQFQTARLKIKLNCNIVKQKGFDILVIRLAVTEDKFENKDYTIVSSGIERIFIDFPGNILQSFQGQRDNNDSYNSGVSVYNFIPIKAWTMSTCDLAKGDILVYRLLRYSIDNSQSWQIHIFQVANVGPKATNTILYNEYTISPYNFDMNEYPAVKKLVENYQSEEVTLD